MNDFFRKFATRVANAVGQPHAFVIALGLILLWGTTGPIFGFSNTWQLMINTGTTIVTLLMVFLIQNTQNRDSKAMHIKLDELIRAVKGASSKTINLEEMPDDQIEELQDHYRKVQTKYHKELAKRRKTYKEKKKNKK